METIFDYNPTEEELDEIFCSREDYEAQPDELISSLFSMRKKENYIKDITVGAPNEEATLDAAMLDIVKLIWIRDGREAAKKYARRIKDPIRRFSKLNLLGGF